MDGLQATGRRRQTGSTWCWLLAPLGLLLTGCGTELVLDPQGPGAAGITRSWWILYWVAAAVVVLVFILLALAVWRRRSGADDPDAERRGKSVLIWAGGVAPLLVLLATTVFILLGMRQLEADAEPVEVITVTGHMFWWELEYQEGGFASANELHIPVGQPVLLELESADVIHSFWVPQLAGKMELVPGRTNQLVIQADAPGAYSGFCAEFCGPGHSKMRLIVVAQMPDDYEAWVERQAADAPEPDTELAQEGRQVFERLICSNCHTIRGVAQATEGVAPDLTHLSSRSTLAARELPNTRQHLANWILSPQDIKPGTQMPPTPMSGRDLDALIAFLGVRE